MPLRRAREPVSDRVWARLTPRESLVEESALEEPAIEESASQESGIEKSTRPTEAVDRGWLPEPPDRAGGGRDAARRSGRIRVEVPGRLKGGDWWPSRKAALGLVVAVLVAVIVFGVRLALAAGQSSPQLIRPADGASTSQGITSSGPTAAVPDAKGGDHTSGAGTPSPDPSGVGVVVVDVVGQVVSPRLVTLPAGSRVADAISAAGGATADADLAAINQARLLVDGEQIRVPLPGEVIQGSGATGGNGASGSGAGGASGGTGAGPGAGPGAGLISLNTADAATLESLPGVGPVLAQRILDWRSEHGRFTSVDELGEVSGIGQKMLAQIRPKVTL